MKKNRLRILKLLVLGSFLLHSCGDSKCYEITEKLNSLDCINDKCQLDFKELFIEEWDELFIFHGFNTPKDISNVIGFEYKGEAIYDHNRLVLEIANNIVLNETTTDCFILNLDRVLQNGYYKIDKNNSVVNLIVNRNVKKNRYTISE